MIRYCLLFILSNKKHLHKSIKFKHSVIQSIPPAESYAAKPMHNNLIYFNIQVYDGQKENIILVIHPQLLQSYNLLVQFVHLSTFISYIHVVIQNLLIQCFGGLTIRSPPNIHVLPIRRTFPLNHMIPKICLILIVQIPESKLILVHHNTKVS